MTPTVGGIDWGFHNPFCALWGTVDHDGVLWVFGCRYKSQTTLPVHSEAIPKNVQWWADPSGAESIASLRHAGHNVLPCVHQPVRGAGGERKNPKLAGIDQVSDRMRTGRLKIVRNEQTMPLIRELSMYHYDEDKKLEEPVDEDNHACDALRYLVVGLDRGRHVGSVVEYPAEVEELEWEKADRQADLDRRRKLDEEAREDPLLDRWFNI